MFNFGYEKRHKIKVFQRCLVNEKPFDKSLQLVPKMTPLARRDMKFITENAIPCFRLSRKCLLSLLEIVQAASFLGKTENSKFQKKEMYSKHVFSFWDLEHIQYWNNFPMIWERFEPIFALVFWNLFRVFQLFSDLTFWVENYWFWVRTFLTVMLIFMSIFFKATFLKAKNGRYRKKTSKNAFFFYEIWRQSRTIILAAQ